MSTAATRGEQGYPGPRHGDFDRTSDFNNRTLRERLESRLPPSVLGNVQEADCRQEAFSVLSAS